MPKVKAFYHLTEDGEEAAQFYIENEDDENDAYEIVNPTRPRSRPRKPKAGFLLLKKDGARATPKLYAL